MKNIKLIVKEDIELVDYLVKYTDFSKSKIKSYLKFKKIIINNSKKIKLPYILEINDEIVIDLMVDKGVDFEILYEDKEILVINKDAGLLTVATEKEKDETLYHQVRDYALNNRFKVFIVHRLDKETSGIVLFAKTEKLKKQFQDNWNDLVITRGYAAIVEGIVADAGRIDNLLVEEKNTMVHSSRTGKRAITNYEPVKSYGEYTLLDVEIETGRKNQIRVHFSELGHPIIGDKKYGSNQNPIKRLGLHAYILEVKHPANGKILSFKSPLPIKFEKLIKIKRY
jgi:Pseudouridylate synthases, 23S RNA-specific